MIDALRRQLQRPIPRNIVAVTCVAILATILVKTLTPSGSVDPRTIVKMPTGFDLACDACQHAWHGDPADYLKTFEGQLPNHYMTLLCPKCGKRAGHLLESCPWCRRPLPRNAPTRICPHCHNDPDKWTASAVPPVR